MALELTLLNRDFTSFSVAIVRLSVVVCGRLLHSGSNCDFGGLNRASCLRQPHLVLHLMISGDSPTFRMSNTLDIPALPRDTKKVKNI